MLAWCCCLLYLIYSCSSFCSNVNRIVGKAFKIWVSDHGSLLDNIVFGLFSAAGPTRLPSSLLVPVLIEQLTSIFSSTCNLKKSVEANLSWEYKKNLSLYKRNNCLCTKTSVFDVAIDSLKIKLLWSFVLLLVSACFSLFYILLQV